MVNPLPTLTVLFSRLFSKFAPFSQSVTKFDFFRSFGEICRLFAKVAFFPDFLTKFPPDTHCFVFAPFFWAKSAVFPIFWRNLLFSQFLNKICGIFTIVWWNLPFYRDCLTKLAFFQRSCDKINFSSNDWQNLFFSVIIRRNSRCCDLCPNFRI